MAQRTEQTSHDDSGVPLSVQDRIAEQLFGGGDDAGPQGNQQQDDDIGPAEDNRQVEGEEEEEAAQASGADEEGDEEGTPGTALEEVEWDGQQYKVPKPLKEALMRHAEFTRGTQETADLRRMIDLERIQQQHLAQFNDAVADDLTKKQQLDWQLSAYRALDWTAMDSETATKANITVSRLRDERDELERTLNQKRQRFDQEMGTLLQTAKQRGEEYLRRHIKDWSPQIDATIQKYGVAEGYSDIEMQMLSDARMKKTLWKAMQYDRLRSQHATGQRRVQRPAPGLQPRGATSHQTAQQVRDKQYREKMRRAKSSSEKASLIQDRLAEKLFGP